MSEVAQPQSPTELNLNIQEIQNAFDSVPKLPFVLRAENNTDVNIFNLNNAQNLINMLAGFPRIDVYEFLELVANSKDEDGRIEGMHPELENICHSDGFRRFEFYLTVYCNRLQGMLEPHTYSYLKKRELVDNIDFISTIDYHPPMIDEKCTNNPWRVLFKGDKESFMTFMSKIDKVFMRITLKNGDSFDLSAPDILSYAGVPLN